MKKLKFNRKQILRLVSMAFAALLLTTGRGHAQFVYNNSTPADKIKVSSSSGTTNSLVGGGTFSGYFLDSGLGKNDVVIGDGSDITSQGSILDFGQSGGGGGSVINRGTLTSNSNRLGSTITAVDLGTAATPLQLTNGGTISAAYNGFDSGAYTGRGVDMEATGTGAVRLENTSSGTVTASAHYQSTAVSISGEGGRVTMENYGSISSGAYYSQAEGIVTTNAGGDIYIENAKSVSASGYYQGQVGISAAITNSGDIPFNNSGSISTSSSGIYSGANGVALSTGTGSIKAVSSGSISVSAYQAQGLVASSGKAFSLENTGSIDAEANYQGEEGFGPHGPGIGVSVSAIRDILIQNDGSIRGTSSSYSGQSAEGINAVSTGGAVYIENSNAVSSSNSLNGNSYGIAASGQSAGVELVNSGSVTTYDAVAEGYGISISATGSTAIPGKAIFTNTGSISGSGYGGVTGVQIAASESAINVTNGLGGSISALGQSSGGLGSNYGILVQNSSLTDQIVNQGTISSNGIGIQDLGTGNITFTEKGGSISSASGFKAVVLGSGMNTVKVIGSSAIVGTIDGGSSFDNSLSFSGISATPDQISQFKSVSQEAKSFPSAVYSVTLGSATYSFTDFDNVTGSFTSSTN